MKEIVVISGKGGTGKTTITASLAYLLNNAVITDCDVDAANLYLLLHPQEYQKQEFFSMQKAVIDTKKCMSCGICKDMCAFGAIEHISGEYRVNGVICDGCKLCYRRCPANAISLEPSAISYCYTGKVGNRDMVYAKLSPGEDNSGKLVNMVREIAKQKARENGSDYILSDGPPGIGCPVISALTGCNTALLITEPTASGLHDLKRALQLVNSFGIEAFVAINKYDLNIAISCDIALYCAQNGAKLAAVIPFDKNVVQSMVKGLPIVLEYPDSEASKAIYKIFNTIK